MIAFKQEVDAAGIELMKLLDVDVEQAGFEGISREDVRKLMEAKQIRFERLSHPNHPFRLVFRAMYRENVFIVGYLIYYHPTLHHIRRTRLDDLNECNAALLFLKGDVEAWQN